MTASPGAAGAGIITATPTMQAVVSINGQPISSVLNGRLIRVVVDNHVNLPGMFELTFLDYDCTTLTLGGIKMGSAVQITGQDDSPGPAIGTLSAAMAGPLITGEVTALEGTLSGQRRLTVVRGYTLAHRLQRARKSQTFISMTDSDIALQIAAAAGLPPGTIEPTTTVHGYLAQVNQTDWEFLRSRALEIGYDTGVSNGQFYFRSAGPAASTAKPVTVTFPGTLFSFRPRVSSGNLTPDVEVRVWDPMQMQAFAASATMATGGTISPASLGAQFKEGALAGVAASMPGAALAASLTGGIGAATAMTAPLAAASPLGQPLAGAAALGSPLGSLGPPPSPTAHIVTDRPVADGLTMLTGGQVSATALSTDLSGTFAEAEGETFGNPAIQPGAMLLIEGTQDPFGGEWLVSHARHVFDDSEFGYRTCFSAHGRQDRSVLGLTSGGPAARRQGPAADGVLPGVVCGVVSNVFDVLGRARVKVTLPWLSPTFETDWAPVAQPCVGPQSGTLFLPSVGDEVLVAFEQGDPRRPYVLGSFVNNYTGFSLTAGGPMAALGSLAGGLGGMAGQLASAAGSLQSVAGDVASLTAAGQLMNLSGMAPPGMSGSPGNLPSAVQGLGGSAFGLAADQLGSAAAATGPGLVMGQAGLNVQGMATGSMASTGSALGVPSSGQPSAGMTGVGTAASGLAGALLTPGLGAVQQSPGMVGEVVRRGFVSDTGNVLVFNDQSIPGPGAAVPGAGAGLAAAGGASAPGPLGAVTDPLAAAASPPGGGLGTMGAAGSPASSLAGGAASAAGQAIASSVTLGAQSGTHGIYVDQVASMVMLQANAVPGVSMSPMPMLVISAGGPAAALGGATGAAAPAGGAAPAASPGGATSGASSTGAAGAAGSAAGGAAAAAAGSIIISAGTDVTIASQTTLNLMAPEVIIAGETVTVVGELIPLTPG